MQTWQLYQPGQLNYRDCWAWQQQLVNAQKANANLADTLILVEHPPIYTLGQGADVRFIKFDMRQSDIEVLRVERGGEVTYHAPGQLVAYPILNLKRYKPDLHWYLRQLESVVIQVLAHFGLQGERIPGLTGVWIERHKVAALGIKVSQWITMHGFALNVNLDLQGYNAIVPCGISDRPVGSLAEFIPNLRVEQVYPVVLAAFATIFNVQFQIQPFSFENLNLRPAETINIAKSG